MLAAHGSQESDRWAGLYWTQTSTEAISKEDRATAAASGNRFSAGVGGNFRKNGRDRA